jgi:hypothetical protein
VTILAAKMSVDALQRERAEKLLHVKQRNRQQLENLAAQYEGMRARRDQMAHEVETLRNEVEAEVLQQERAASVLAAGAGEGGASSSPEAETKRHARRWSGTLEGVDTIEGADGVTLSDDQITDALANLLDFSATKSNIRSSEKS